MEIGSFGNLEAIALESGDSRSWTLFPYAIYRIAKFSSLYDSDADVALMVSHLKQSFVHPNGSMLILLLLDRESKEVVGHLLVTMEGWFGTPFATIVQYELDRAVPRKILNDGYEYVNKWAQAHGAKFVQCLARNDKVAKAFEVFFGFERNRIVMRKNLSTDVARRVETV